VKWAKYFLCYLRGAVVRLWGLSSRACSDSLSRLAGKSMSWNWHEKVVQMKISLNCKITWLIKVLASLLVLVGVLLLSWGCSRSAPQYYFQRAFLQSNGSVSRTPPEKVEQSGYLDSYHTQQAKTQSLYLWDTYPIWGRRLSVASSDFILGHRQGDK